MGWLSGIKKIAKKAMPPGLGGPHIPGVLSLRDLDPKRALGAAHALYGARHLARPGFGVRALGKLSPAGMLDHLKEG